MEKDDVMQDFNNGFSRFVRIGGATASVTLIALILYFLNIIPEGVSLSIGLFVSLPIVFSFIFGIIFNKPNFSNVFRHYSFTGYLLISLVIFMFVLKPTSITEGTKYLFHFIFGLFLSIVSYFTYAISYKLSSIKIEKYRWRALISFGTSFAITFIITFILKHFNVFELI